MALTRIQKDKPQSAFTLLEMAIVLGVAGIILSGVWVAGSSVWRNHQRQKTFDQIMTVVQNVRDYFAASSTATGGAKPWPVAGTLMNGTMRTLNLIPSEMLLDRTNAASDKINHDLGADPSGGGSSLRLESINQTPMRLRVRLLGLGKDDCVNLLVRMPATSPEIGLTYIGTAAAGTNVAIVNNFSDPSGSGIKLPILPSQAVAWCNKTDSSNEVRFDFNVRN